MKKYILLTGGAGFVGGYVNTILQRQGFSTIIIDNLSRGLKESVDDSIFFQGDVGDPEFLDHLFHRYPIEAVLHFAGSISVGESFVIPAHYYKNNVSNTLTLLEKMMQHHVDKFVFSSSAGVYGIAKQEKITEEHPLDPINPYGRTKLMVEKILDDYHAVYGLKSISLRYFNAAGGDPQGNIPLYPRKECNLIPIILQGLLSPPHHLQLFGNDYPTFDGTCVRDYIHLDDLAQGHVLALKTLLNGESRKVYNLGNGSGYSNLEVVETIEAITGSKVDYSFSPRRQGDPPILVADSSKAERELGWQRRYPALSKIVEDAWIGMCLGFKKEVTACK